jgi:hypothetical protein
MYAELVYHVPLTIWAIGALIRGMYPHVPTRKKPRKRSERGPNVYTPDDPLVPLHLLVFGLECSITTAVCVIDFMNWSDFSHADKIELGKLYGPYLALCKCFARLHYGVMC